MGSAPVRPRLSGSSEGPVLRLLRPLRCPCCLSPWVWWEIFREGCSTHLAAVRSPPLSTPNSNFLPTSLRTSDFVLQTFQSHLSETHLRRPRLICRRLTIVHHPQAIRHVGRKRGSLDPAEGANQLAVVRESIDQQPLEQLIADVVRERHL